MKNRVLDQKGLSFKGYQSLLFCLGCLGCQANTQVLPPQAKRLYELGMTPVEIQLSVHASPIWSLTLPKNWEKQELSSELQLPWKLLASWTLDTASQQTPCQIKLWTRAPFSSLALDSEMENLERQLGASSRPTFSQGITQNGMIGIIACRNDDTFHWRWALLTPDPALAKQAPLPAMQQPLFLWMKCETSDELENQEAVFEAVYQSLHTLKTFQDI
jgi:hypothetical protein